MKSRELRDTVGILILSVLVPAGLVLVMWRPWLWILFVYCLVIVAGVLAGLARSGKLPAVILALTVACSCGAVEFPSNSIVAFDGEGNVKMPEQAWVPIGSPIGAWWVGFGCTFAIGLSVWTFRNAMRIGFGGHRD